VKVWQQDYSEEFQYNRHLVFSLHKLMEEENANCEDHEGAQEDHEDHEDRVKDPP
jgi:hypothetical protein